MSRCLKINQCVECDYRIEDNCVKCAGNHTLNAVTNTCECKTSPACLSTEICVEYTGQCLDALMCTKNPYCTTCSSLNPERCGKCVSGYILNNNGQCERLPCADIQHCRSCDLRNNKLCESCEGNYVLKGICECVPGSQTGCATDETCTPKLQCQKKNRCLTINKCVKCIQSSPEKCEICENGFQADTKGDSCISSNCNDQNCLSCPDKSNCRVCQSNLTYSQSNFLCECVPGSKTGCHLDFECVRSEKVCVPKSACLSLVVGCEFCWYHDTRLCETCISGLILSVDRKQCIAQNACNSIRGCSKCVEVVPNLCEVCKGELKDFGRSCSGGNLGAGAIVGIIIALIIIIVGIILGVLFGMKIIGKKQFTTNKPKVMPRKDFA